ncbi:VOC family protein [Serratia marcescens]|uniref:VOC family protein n=1 Tax=Serratia marcescens TaxID=615 RepID=UPI0011E6D81D|nr:VOC family protein [Serratia marcescens]
MFDHVKCGVSDFALSKAFFLNALAPARKDRRCPEQVDAFYHAALSTAGRDNGAPVLRLNHAHYCAACVIGQVDHSVEAVCHNTMAWYFF